MYIKYSKQRKIFHVYVKSLMVID